MYTQGVTDGDDFVDSPSDATIVATIRTRYLRDAALAIVLLGESTWSRRFVDWEIAAALGGPGDVPLPVLAVTYSDPAPDRSPPRLGPVFGRPITLRSGDRPDRFVAAVTVTARAWTRQVCADRPPLMRRDLRH